LDLSNNPLLEGLSCNNNLLSSLNISNNLLLLGLSCTNNLLSSLDLSNNSLLEWLECSYNQLTSLNVSGNPNIYSVGCSNNPFTQNQTAAIQFANSLPNRTGQMSGFLGWGSNATAHWITAIYTAKNWWRAY
jgi:Leucine-rich repeat (LRR) protein